MDDNTPNETPENGNRNLVMRAGLQVAAGAIPLFGGLLAAAAGAWGEHEQARVNRIFQQWLQMLRDELAEKERTLIEIMARVDMTDEKIRQRIESPEYQALMKKAFRNWSNIDSESKRQKVRNLLSNAAATSLTSDDVVKLFLDWMDTYSDFHFEVIAQIYQHPRITRGQIWRNLAKPDAREDSAEADLYRLLVHDLSTGRVVRQARSTDTEGNFLKKAPVRRSPGHTDQRMKSAFDDEEEYVLTELGRQFVHYAMNELAPRITFDADAAPAGSPH